MLVFEKMEKQGREKTGGGGETRKFRKGWAGGAAIKILFILV